MALIYIIKNGEMTPYIGSTTNSLKKRLQLHNSNKKAYENNKTNICASYVLLNGNETIELLEECEIGDQFVREQHYIDTIPNCNNYKAYRTEEQKAEAEKKRHKIYYEANCEKINEAKKIHYQSNKEAAKEQQRIYKAANREKIKEYQRIYKAANREKINEKQRIYRAKKLLG